MQIKPWTIYIWKNGDKIEGASKVETRDGINDIYRTGWEIEKDPDSKRNKQIQQEWRAKIKVKNMLTNTLNVLNWYGKKVLDNKGDIDVEKLKNLEAISAMQAVKKKKDINDLYPFKKYDKEDITLKQAEELELR